ncbi:MAG: endo-1,4-beta-xylanase, partial [Vallitaleaceae bacterium]|nr:endo-1,4-beta-xylanase [Vallitaleaceae bacterium]
MKQKLAIFLVFILTLGVLYQPTLKTVKAAEDSDLLVKNDFSTGAEGWQARGATIEVVTEGGLDNSANVKVSGRTANWNGVQKDMLATALAGSAYDYSVYVYFEGEAGTNATLKLSAQKTIDGVQGWDTIAQADVEANTWTELAGTYTLANSGVASEFVVYVEATNESLEFSIDEFTLRGEATTSPTTSWTYDFETDLGIWGSRTGTEKVEIVTTLGHESTSSAKVWERSQNYHGISTNAASLFVKDKVYQIEFYVYQESGSDKEIYLTMQKKVDAEDTSYTRLATAATKSGEWTKVNTSYSYTDAGTINELVLYFEAEVGLDFYLDDVSISTSADEVVPEIQKDLVGIKELYEDHFSIGVAIPDQALSNELMKELVIKHFNSITAENSMKPEAMLDASNRGQIRFNVSDLYDQFASENNMGLRGHTLVWHSQTPDWFFKEDFQDDGALVTREVMLERMENYIKVVAEHYKNTSVYAWDVVNEAVESSRPDGMRKSLWYDVIGPDFVYKAFEYARKYTEGTDIKLFYNDYSVNDVAKRTAIINLLTPIKEAGLIDGMGIQGHINMTFPSIGLFSETIGLFEDMDLEVQVTELDVSVYENDNERMETASEELLIRQGYRYKQLFDMFKTHEG